MHSNTDRFTCAHKISHHAPGAGLRADQRRAGPEARALHVVRQAEGGHRRGHAAAPESGPGWGRGPATAGVGRQAYMACGGPEGKYSEHRRLFCESRTRKAKRKLERGKEWLSLVFFSLLLVCRCTEIRRCDQITFGSVWSVRFTSAPACRRAAAWAGSTDGSAGPRVDARALSSRRGSKSLACPAAAAHAVPWSHAA